VKRTLLSAPRTSQLGGSGPSRAARAAFERRAQIGRDEDGHGRFIDVGGAAGNVHARKLRERLLREECFDARLGLIRGQGERHPLDAGDPRSGENDRPRRSDDRLLGALSN
jgi:hypothetical protein